MACILELSSHESSYQKDFKKEKKKIPTKRFLSALLPVATQLRLMRSTSFLVEFFKKDLRVGVSATVQIFSGSLPTSLFRKMSKLQKVEGINSTVNLQMPLCSPALPVCFAPPSPCLLVTVLTKPSESWLSVALRPKMPQGRPPEDEGLLLHSGAVPSDVWTVSVGALLERHDVA